MPLWMTQNMTSHYYRKEGSKNSNKCSALTQALIALPLLFSKSCVPIHILHSMLNCQLLVMYISRLYCLQQSCLQMWMDCNRLRKRKPLKQGVGNTLDHIASFRWPNRTALVLRRKFKNTCTKGLSNIYWFFFALKSIKWSKNESVEDDRAIFVYFPSKRRLRSDKKYRIGQS